jgi:hypothetical protein
MPRLFPPAAAGTGAVRVEQWVSSVPVTGGEYPAQGWPAGGHGGSPVTPADADGRRSIVGRVLTDGHPVRDAYLHRRDPLDNESRNPVGYVELPEEEQFRLRACACGCGTETKRDFAPGHDQKAIHDRIKAHFEGSTLAFIHWMDQYGPAAASAPHAPS